MQYTKIHEVVFNFSSNKHAMLWVINEKRLSFGFCIYITISEEQQFDIKECFADDLQCEITVFR